MIQNLEDLALWLGKPVHEADTFFCGCGARSRTQNDPLVVKRGWLENPRTTRRFTVNGKIHINGGFSNAKFESRRVYYFWIGIYIHTCTCLMEILEPYPIVRLAVSRSQSPGPRWKFRFDDVSTPGIAGHCYTSDHYIFYTHTHIYLGIYLCLHILMHIHMHILITHECRTWWWYSRKTTVLIHQCFSHLLHIPGLAINHHVEKTYTQSINIYIYTRAYGINNNIWICFSHIYIYICVCMYALRVCMHACMYVCYVMSCKVRQRQSQRQR